jgi:ferredoxin-NADP reductase
MTASQLLAWIAGALLLQLLLGGAWAYRRRRTQPLPAPLPVMPAAQGAAWQGLRAFRVQSRAYEDAAHSQCSFYLVPLDAEPLPAFKPGQFLTFVLALPEPGQPGRERSVTRCYSLSDAPDPAQYRVTIKRQPDGLVSRHFHDQVQPGQVLQLRAPAGHFHIDAEGLEPAVLVAGGIGITPMLSMLRWCLAHQPQRRLHLFYGLRHGGEHAFKAQLEQLAAAHPQLTLTVAYSRPAVGDRLGADYQHAGHVDLELLRRTLPHGRHRFFLCGPPALMASLVPALAALGVPESDIHYEAFGPASVPRPGAAAAAEAGTPPGLQFQLRFERSGRSLGWDGSTANLLDFAEAHGIAVDSGCRSGGCGSCETRLLEGSVHYQHRPDHDPAPGHCLLCVAQPATDLVLEA